MKRSLLQINLTLSIILTLFLSVSAQTSALNKNSKVNEITDLTIATLPIDKLQTVFNEFGGIISKNLTAKFTANIEQELNSKKGLTAAQKKKALDKSPILVERLSVYIKQSATKKFNQLNSDNTKYYKESFANYPDDELTELYNFLISPTGKQYLSLLKQVSDNRFLESPKEVVIDDQYKAKIKEFIDTPLGVKYQKTIDAGNASMAEKVKTVPDTFGKDISAAPQLMKIINDFIETEL